MNLLAVSKHGNRSIIKWQVGAFWLRLSIAHDLATYCSQQRLVLIRRNCRCHLKKRKKPRETNLSPTGDGSAPMLKQRARGGNQVKKKGVDNVPHDFHSQGTRERKKTKKARERERGIESCRAWIRAKLQATVIKRLL